MIRAAALLLLVGATPALGEPLLVDNGRLFIAAKVNGIETEALLDSGAEASLIDLRLAAEARLPEGQAITIKGSGGSAVARFIEGVAIEALGLKVQGEGVVAMDMTDLSQRLIKRPTRAIVGRELFDAARLRIDLAGGAIDAVDRGLPPPGMKLELTAHAGIESLPVLVNGIPAQAEFDLGNGSEPLVSRAFASRLGLKIDGKKVGGGIGGEIQRDLVEIARLEVAGKQFRNLIAAIDDQPNANDMNIGTSILRHFLVTADFKERAVWLQPADK